MYIVDTYTHNCKINKLYQIKEILSYEVFRKIY